jgi:hypothetical protein
MRARSLQWDLMSTPLDLSAAARHAMAQLAGDLVRVFGDRFVALVAYGPTRAAAFASTIVADDLEALAPLVDRWQREGLDTPLLLTPHEFERSLDAFPLEYGAMLDRHVLVAGTSPFTAARPSEHDLRRACEIQAKAFLIHLRQGWVQASDHAHEQAHLLAHAAEPLRALLANLARLQGAAGATDADLAAFGATVTRAPADLVARILELQAHPERAAGSIGEMNAWLGFAEQLWAYVDSWQA